MLKLGLALLPCGAMAGRIFINYRRGDDPGFAGRLFDQLDQHFDRGESFLDVHDIPAGHDFMRVLDEQVNRCDVFLALIGKTWLDARDATGRPKLEDPDDPVRIELSSALKLNKRIFPILINNAEMPSAANLPEILKPFASRQALRLTHDRFRADVQTLIKIVGEALKEAEAETLQRREEEIAKAAEMGRLEKEQLRVAAQAGEISHWEFIKESTDAQELRDHLKRFPGGLTEERARARLEQLIWSQLGETPRDIAAFISEFPNSSHLAAAKDRLPQSAYGRQAFIALTWLLGALGLLTIASSGLRADRPGSSVPVVFCSLLALIVAGMFAGWPSTVAKTPLLPWNVRIGALSLSIYWLGATCSLVVLISALIIDFHKGGLEGIVFVVFFTPIFLLLSVSVLVAFLVGRARAKFLLCGGRQRRR
jgi:hypothetical protein